MTQGIQNGVSDTPDPNNPPGPVGAVDSNGTTTQAGYVFFAEADYETLLFQKLAWEYMPMGSGASNSWTKIIPSPLPAPKDKAWKLAADSYDSSWVLVDDYIGQTIWNESNAADSKVVTQIGPIPNGWTTVAPNSPDDVWNPKTNSWDQYVAPKWKEAQKNFSQVQMFINNAIAQGYKISNSVYSYQRQLAKMGWPNGMPRPELDTSEGLPTPPNWDDSKPYGGWAFDELGDTIDTGLPAKPNLIVSPASETFNGTVEAPTTLERATDMVCNESVPEEPAPQAEQPAAQEETPNA